MHMSQVIREFNVVTRSPVPGSVVVEHARVAAQGKRWQPAIIALRHGWEQRGRIDILVLAAELGAVIAPCEAELIHGAPIECVRFRQACREVVIRVAPLAVIRRIVRIG